MTMHPRHRGSSLPDPDRRSIERRIAGLSGSIRPRERLRDEVLQSAADSVGKSNSRLRSAQVTVTLSILLLVIAPLLGALTRVKAPMPATARQANSAALRHAEVHQISFDWALVDIFDRFHLSGRDGKVISR